jgi:hypothetical protein
MMKRRVKESLKYAELYLYIYFQNIAHCSKSLTASIMIKMFPVSVRRLM